MNASRPWFLDSPITDSAQDLYNFDPAAHDLAVQLVDTFQHTDGQRITMSINAPWGMGKSSFLKLLKNHLTSLNPQLRVLDFDLWMSGSVETLLVQNLQILLLYLAEDAGQSQLVNQLTDWLSQTSAIAPGIVAALTLPLGSLSSVLATVGTKLLGTAAKKSSEKRPGNINDPLQLRSLLINLLEQQDKQLVIMVDELDRLSPSELLVVFRLTKALASLPKISVIAAFDPEVVDQALQGYGGIAFAEKIFNWPYFMPPVHGLPNCLRLLQALDVIASPSQLDKLRSQDIDVLNALTPVLTNGRKTKRLCLAVLYARRRTLGVLDTVTQIAIEAIRMTDPTMLDAVLESIDVLKDPFANLKTPNGQAPTVSGVLNDLIGRHRASKIPMIKSLCIWLFRQVEQRTQHMTSETFGTSTAEMYVRLEAGNLRDDIQVAQEIEGLLHLPDIKVAEAKVLGYCDKPEQGKRLVSMLFALSTAERKPAQLKILFNLTMMFGDLIYQSVSKLPKDGLISSPATSYAMFPRFLTEKIQGASLWPPLLKRALFDRQQYYTAAQYFYALRSLSEQDDAYKAIASRWSTLLRSKLRASLKNRGLPSEVEYLHFVLDTGRELGLQQEVGSWMRAVCRNPLRFAQVLSRFEHTYSSSGTKVTNYHCFEFSTWSELKRSTIRSYARRALDELDEPELEELRPALEYALAWNGTEDSRKHYL